MSTEPAVDPADAIVDGLTSIASAADDVSIGKDGAGLYRDVRSAIDGQFRPDDQVNVAFPCIYMMAREAALAVVFADRVVVAWSKGMFKPKVVLDVIPRTDISSAAVASGTGANSRATFLTLEVQGRGVLQLALPSPKPALGALVLASLGFGASPTA